MSKLLTVMIACIVYVMCCYVLLCNVARSFLYSHWSLFLYVMRVGVVECFFLFFHRVSMCSLTCAILYFNLYF